MGLVKILFEREEKTHVLVGYAKHIEILQGPFSGKVNMSVELSVDLVETPKVSPDELLASIVDCESSQEPVPELLACPWCCIKLGNEEFQSCPVCGGPLGRSQCNVEDDEEVQLGVGKW